MADENPFELATPTAAPEAKENPFQNLYLVAIARMRDEDGKERDVVTIKSRADQSIIELRGNEPNADGLSVAGIEWTDQLKNVVVTLKKGTEIGSVKYDEAAFQAAAQPVPAAGARPGGPGARGPQVRGGAPAPVNAGTGVPLPAGANAVQGQTNRLGVQGNRIQPIVPRPNAIPAQNQPLLQPAPAGQVPAAAPQQGDSRRRIRVINSRP